MQLPSNGKVTTAEGQHDPHLDDVAFELSSIVADGTEEEFRAAFAGHILDTSNYWILPYGPERLVKALAYQGEGWVTVTRTNEEEVRTLDELSKLGFDGILHSHAFGRDDLLYRIDIVPKAILPISAEDLTILAETGVIGSDEATEPTRMNPKAYQEVVLARRSLMIAAAKINLSLDQLQLGLSQWGPPYLYVVGAN